ncbi:hypothetical protein KEM52_003501 [Ascosphaera acerosa]|nr:hypothetical protein KEM52_003501 [Ascosphaera acerosa]
MTGLSGLSAAHLVLVAVQRCLAGDASALPRLRALAPDVLSPALCLRIILTFLPETVPPAQYAPVVRLLIAGDGGDDGVDEAAGGDGAIDIDASIAGLSVAAATSRVNRLRLRPLAPPALRRDTAKLDGLDSAARPLMLFLVHRAHRIDSETGLQTYLPDLLGPFLATSAVLRRWTVSRVLPLLRTNYEYAAQCSTGPLSLEVIDSFDAATATNFFLAASPSSGLTTTDGQALVGRDIRGLVGPWMYGLRPDDGVSDADAGAGAAALVRGWHEVNEWLVSTSRTDFALAAAAVEQWGGPSDVDYGGYLDVGEVGMPDGVADRLRENYARAAIACVYSTDEVGPEALAASCQILARLASLTGHDETLQLQHSCSALSEISFEGASWPSVARPQLLQRALLHETNPLTAPTLQALTLLDALIISARTLHDLGKDMTVRECAELCLVADQSQQETEFRAVMELLRSRPRKHRDWAAARVAMRWLSRWSLTSCHGTPHSGIFWLLDDAAVEAALLQTMLHTEQYQAALDMYITSQPQQVLPLSRVEEIVITTALDWYDNATNGNQTRGRMKAASDLLKAFAAHLPESLAVQRIGHLIAATHSLSSYSLTLQPGVPLRPAAIRSQHDPLGLIEKVLQQNRKAYARVKDLTAIGRDLVAAGYEATPAEELDHFDEGDAPEDRGDNEKDPLRRVRSPDMTQHELDTAERRILAMAVKAALASDDFETANSLIMTRIAPTSAAFKDPSPESLKARGNDDYYWRAAFAAGTYRGTTTLSVPLYQQIRHLGQRMELLSLAILLAIPSSLGETLAAWNECDAEARVLRKRESEEEEAWASQGDRLRLDQGGGMRSQTGKRHALERGERPAGSARQSLDDEAPMGLFDVARGAARALKKNALQLRTKAELHHMAAATPTAAHAAGSLSAHDRQESAPTSDQSGSVSLQETLRGTTTPTTDSAHRLRKRDMVSSMVTGGLASGLGWVLGAQPVLVRQQETGTERPSQQEAEEYDELGRRIEKQPQAQPGKAQAASSAANSCTDRSSDRAAAAKHLPAPTAAAVSPRDDDAEVDDGWEASWGDEADTTSEHATTDRTAGGATVDDAHIKPEADEKEDWEANWGWD